jgi:hypothetical protein
VKCGLDRQQQIMGEGEQVELTEPGARDAVRSEMGESGQAETRRQHRPRLNSEQQREIGQLYIDSGMSAAEIRRSYGISEMSVYRILRRQGIRPRGRATGSKPVGYTAEAGGGRARLGPNAGAWKAWRARESRQEDAYSWPPPIHGGVPGRASRTGRRHKKTYWSSWRAWKRLLSRQ